MEDTARTFGEEWAELNACVSKRMRETLAETGISHLEWHTLVWLYATSHPDQTDVPHGRSRPQISDPEPILTDLVERRYIRRGRGRLSLDNCTLTRDGQRLVLALSAMNGTVLEQCLCVLSPAEQQTLVGLLRRVRLAAT